METDPGVIHKKMTAQEYFQAAGQFDMVVNDMKMDTGESAQMMGLAAGCLRPEGLAVMTLKLPKRGMQKIVNQTLRRLEQWYDLTGARQLFHNRSEITVALRRRQDESALVCRALDLGCKRRCKQRPSEAVLRVVSASSGAFSDKSGGAIGFYCLE